MRQEYYNDNEDIIDEMRRNKKCWMNLTIIAVNILVFMLVEITGSSEDTSHMIKWGASYTPLLEQGQYYRLFTSMFLHFGTEHLLNNMLLLFFAGYYLERYVGKICYLVIYLGGGLLGSLCSWLIEVRNNETVVSAGASGAIFAVLGGLVIMVLLHQGDSRYLSLRRLLLMIVFSVYVGFRSAGVDNSAHLGGLIGGALIALLICAIRRLGSAR